MSPTAQPNPFPGLRPFEPEEDHLFFGREKEIDDLLRRLGSHRFLSVIGTSGCGKSSLVRSGLIPSLQSGLMAKAGSSWRIAVMRPGKDPIGQLAAAFDSADVIGTQEGELASTSRVMLEATLRRGTLGVVDAVRQAHIAADDNVLIVVDQFEELFRFRRNSETDRSRDEGVAFVKLLLEATDQKDIPIYVVLTMRSDFIGDCMRYPGLPEAMNESQCLVPRMTRDELRLAITGPVAVAGAAIAPRLVLRLLNEVGDNQDDLPLLQHVLMRTWDHWEHHSSPRTPIDFVNYEAVGTLLNALSTHADEAYEEARAAGGQRNTERIFKALTDTFSDPRGIRRPTCIADLAAICEASESDVIQIVEIFRRAGRSFLTPPPPVSLGASVIVDLSHESLMRCWSRLMAWAQEERASIASYVRLSREASWYEEGAAGLWGDPELELGLRWRRENHPTAAWARQYDESFDRAMRFLDRSEKERDRQGAERRASRVRRLLFAWGTAAVLLVAFVIVAWQAQRARREGARAERNLGLATSAVNELLASADRNQAPSVGADVPQMQQFRGELLERAKRFYTEFIKQQPDNERFVSEMGAAHFRLGQINRMLDDPVEAEKEYRASIAQFESLTQSNPTNARYRQSLANTFNALGEMLRASPANRDEAERAYGRALALQAALVAEAPGNDEYRADLARSHNNRGILYAGFAAPNDPTFRQADVDFREAIRVLEPISQKKTDLQASQDLARTYNNLATLLSQGVDNDQMLQDARGFYERAIRLHNELTARQPGNREYKFELAKFSDNYSYLLRDLGSFELARQNSSRALALLEELARPSPSLGIEQADAHNLRGRILQSERSGEAIGEYRQSLAMFQNIEKANGAGERPDFHLRFGDLLMNLASLRKERPNAPDARALLLDALRSYVDQGVRAADAGSAAEARDVLDNLSRVVAALSAVDRASIAGAYERLQRKLGTGPP